MQHQNIKPRSVSNAIALMWLTLVGSALLGLLDLKLGVIAPPEFFFAVIFYGLCAFFPYKIDRGSNATRWAYVVLTVVSGFILAGAVVMAESWTDFNAVFGASAASSFGNMVLSIITIFGIIPLLFSSSANAWFRGE